MGPGLPSSSKTGGSNHLNLENHGSIGDPCLVYSFLNITHGNRHSVINLVFAAQADHFCLVIPETVNGLIQIQKQDEYTTNLEGGKGY